MSSLTPLKSRGAAPDHRGVGSGEGVVLSNGFFASSNGIELPLTNLTAALAVAFAGPGAYSLDGLFGLTALADPASSRTAVAAAAGLALANLAVRRPMPAPARTHV